MSCFEIAYATQYTWAMDIFLYVADCNYICVSILVVLSNADNQVYNMYNNHSSKWLNDRRSRHMEKERRERKREDEIESMNYCALVLGLSGNRQQATMLQFELNKAR